MTTLERIQTQDEETGLEYIVLKIGHYTKTSPLRGGAKTLPSTLEYKTACGMPVSDISKNGDESLFKALDMHGDNDVILKRMY